MNIVFCPVNKQKNECKPETWCKNAMGFITYRSPLRYPTKPASMVNEAGFIKQRINIPVVSIKERLDRLLNESVTHLPEDFQTFKNGLTKCKDYLFTFLENPNVPYDNNASERGIRKIKVKQKVSGCFRTQQGADDFMNFYSVVETAKKNGNSKYKAILAVLEQ